MIIPRHNSRVSVIAYNVNVASEVSIDVQWRGSGTDPKPTLYVVAIGISNYKHKDARSQLHFAAKDAADFVALAEAQKGGLYEKVITHLAHGSLRNEEATKDAILDEFDWITDAVTNTNDVAMVFLAGHGQTAPDQSYQFLPYDYDPNRIERTTISDWELLGYLKKVVSKKIFFLDTCHSGAAFPQPIVEKFANDLKAPENSIVVFTSSTGNELSLERDDWNNGAFTKVVLDGLRGKAARPEDPLITENELEAYVDTTVPKLTTDRQHPAVAKPTTVADFPIAESSPSGLGRVWTAPLQQQMIGNIHRFDHQCHILR
jgi:uncharacterized caspase-like protein